MHADREKPQRPDYSHLRRFALATGLVLFGVSVAGISLDPSSEVELLGLSFSVARPNLFPYVLLLASSYALVRFYYYGVLVTRSPYAARRDLMDRLVCHQRAPGGLSYAQLRSFGMYTGPESFELGPHRPWIYKRNRREGESEPAQDQPSAWVVENDSHGEPVMPAEGTEFQRELETLFPAVAGARVTTRWNYESREPPMKVRLAVSIPVRCRIAALLEDIDYTAPIWFNLTAIAVFVWSRVAV